MGDIELVIKIPKEAYQLLENKGVDWLGAEHILNAVANGTPLEKVLEDITKSLKTGYFDSNLQAAKDDPCVIDAMIDWAIRKVKGVYDEETKEDH